MDTDTRLILIILLRAVDCRSLQLAEIAQDCIGVRIFSRWHRPKCNHMSSAASCHSGHLLCEFGPDTKMKQESVKRGSTTQNKLHVSTSALCITSTTLKKKNTSRISKAKDAYGSGVHFSHSSRSTFMSESRPAW